MADVAIATLDAAQDAIIVPGTTYYLSLHTGDPGATGASEGTDGRQAIVFGSSSNGTQASTTGQTWASAVGGQAYTHFGVWTTQTGGSYKRGGTLTPAITPPAGVEIVVNAGQIVFTD